MIFGVQFQAMVIWLGVVLAVLVLCVAGAGWWAIKKFGAIQQSLTELCSDIDTNRGMFESLDQDLGGLKENLAKLNERLIAIETDPQRQSAKPDKEIEPATSWQRQRQRAEIGDRQRAGI